MIKINKEKSKSRQVPGVTVSTGFNWYGNTFVHLCIMCQKHGIFILTIRFTETVIGIRYLRYCFQLW